MKVTHAVRTAGSIPAIQRSKAIIVDPAKVMFAIMNLYADKAFCVAREYAANALDSHIEAGQGLPIEITLPTEDKPELIIRDFGIGMSRDDMMGRYGNPTDTSKADRPDQTGGHGFGSKSAYTLTPQFTVIAVKDGWRSVGFFVLEEDGIPAANLIDHSPTEAGNGVEVRIPIADVHDMRRAVARVAMAWKPGTALVDGEQPASIFDGAEELGEGAWMLAATGPSRERHALRVVVGAAMYEVPDLLAEKAIETLDRDAERLARRAHGTRGLAALVEVPVDAVDLAPSREGLQDSPRTVAAVAAAMVRFGRVAGAWAQAKVDAAETLADAAAALAGIAVGRPEVESWGLRWNGEDIGTSVRINFDAASIPSGKDRVRWDSHTVFTIGDWKPERTLFVLDDGEHTEAAARRAGGWLRDSATECDRLVIVPSRVEEDGIGWVSWGEGSPSKVMTAEGFIEADRARRKALPKAPRPASRGTAYHVVSGSRYGLSIDQHTKRHTDEIQGKALYFTAAEFSDMHHIRSAERWLREVEARGATVLALARTNSESLFLQRLPDAEKAAPLLQAWLDGRRKSVTDAERMALGFRESRFMEALIDLDTVPEAEVFAAYAEKYLAARKVSREMSPDRKEELRGLGILGDGGLLEAARQKAARAWPLAPWNFWGLSEDLLRHAVAYIDSMPAIGSDKEEL